MEKDHRCQRHTSWMSQQEGQKFRKKKKFSHWGTRKNDGYEESKG